MSATLEAELDNDWLSLAQAADQLGISRDALRRRIRRGSIASRQVQTRFGPAYEVRLETSGARLVPDDRHPDGRQAGKTATVATPPLAELVTLVRDLGERAERNAAAAAMWQARAEHLADQVAQLERALPEPASTERPFSGDSEGVAVEPTQTSSSTRNGRPWWRFWSA